jgi:hypothetical protein
MFFYSNHDAETRHIIPYDPSIIRTDAGAYKANPNYNFVYNKLFIAQTQKIDCGKMNIYPHEYPVFIKPIINLKGGNLGCYKVNTKQEFERFKHRNDFYWATFLHGQEGSTDFVMDKGNILFELSYVMEKTENSIIQQKTIISPKNKCPQKIKDWIYTYLKDYTGCVNIQYIGNTIIEVGLRFDSGGNFIQWANNPVFIERINSFFKTGKWIHIPTNQYQFKDVYSIGCYKSNPVIYFIPAPIIKLIMENNNIQNYNFYIDNERNGIKYLNIVDSDMDKINHVKEIIETIMNISNTLFLILIPFITILIIFNKNYYGFAIFVILIFLTRFINPPKYTKYLFLRYLKG